MGKRRDKRRRRNRQRTTEEIDLVKEKEMERLERVRVEHERADAEVRAILSAKQLAARAGSDPPPILGEPDSPVRAPRPQATTMVSDCKVPAHRSPLPHCPRTQELSTIVLPPPRNCGADWPARVVGVLAFVQKRTHFQLAPMSEMTFYETANR